MVESVDLFEWRPPEEKGEKVGNVSFNYRSDKNVWPIHVHLEKGKPNQEYLVYLEIDYHLSYNPPQHYGWRFMSLGKFSSDTNGQGSFHYDLKIGEGVTSQYPWHEPWGIYREGDYILGVCLNDITGIELPSGNTSGAGIWENIGKSTYATWGNQGCLRHLVRLMYLI